MKRKATLPEPLEETGSFKIDHALYGETDKRALQDTMKFLHDSILSDQGYTLEQIENMVREKGTEDSVVSDAFEIFELPTYEVAYAQCWLDCSEEADNEIREVKEYEGVVDYPTIINFVASSILGRYEVELKSQKFPGGSRTYTYDFSDKITMELIKRYKLGSE